MAVEETYEQLKVDGVEFPPIDLDSLAPIETPTSRVRGSVVMIKGGAGGWGSTAYGGYGCTAYKFLGNLKGLKLIKSEINIHLSHYK